ncbi:FtsX-like permease family protein [Conexibacter stalactiti]|uniref:FtsX-like permease family protein n=1 Tax=Conexibacter stalactiti TaxID=1940611 RepID=A0ABU4HY00_9ACTN|nr:FtsX-like permease family protein [Conexibacter stalactiti]MDW5597350.1 FtsX-like permease family protein [Conexibacter stalactiti]MEC5037992.1 FtsX-like permease family protein [Conexibacter stalactiti]
MSAWLRDLALGARLARSGGRGARSRVVLTAIGVALGVALLLVAASLPHMLAARDARTDARSDLQLSGPPPVAGVGTLLVADVNDRFRADDVRGRLLRAEGPVAPIPPGLERLPAAGELFVSPALAELLRSEEGALLRERLPQPIAGTIGDAGLAGPAELAWYRGSDDLRLRADDGTVRRIDRFGEPGGSTAPDPVMQLLAVVVLTALLLPVAVFVATAARFGGEARDRRLAALRLLGADMAMARRIAAGEALVSALLGLLLGALLFLGVRRLAGEVTLFGLSVYPGDVTPSAGLALAVALGVPTAAVLLTLAALRGVVVDPLGAVRRARPRRRRVWWRLALPLLGVLLLLPLIGGDTRSAAEHELQLAAGVVLVLVGVAALLPWLVEAAVHRLPGGGVAWQLATRRLQLDSGASARVVSGIAVAVAGAVALQTTFSGVENGYVSGSGDGRTADVWAHDDGRPGAGAQRLAAALQGSDGVRGAVVAGEQIEAGHGDTTEYVRVADCATLRRVAPIDRCADGDVFVVGEVTSLRPGARLRLDGGTSWTIPRDARVLQRWRGSPDPDDGASYSIPDPVLATPGALAGLPLRPRTTLATVTLADDGRDAIEHVRNTVARLDETATVAMLGGRSYDREYANLRRALFAGAVAVLTLIGASMLVGALEQLRERRRPLAVLAAFGTPRGALARALLWQTAIPVALGLALAVAAGAGLGAALLRMVGEPVGFDLASIAGLAATGAAVVLLVTLATLPALRRTVRPEGLRAE